MSVEWPFASRTLAQSLQECEPQWYTQTCAISTLVKKYMRKHQNLCATYCSRQMLHILICLQNSWLSVEWCSRNNYHLPCCGASGGGGPHSHLNQCKQLTANGALVPSRVIHYCDHHTWITSHLGDNMHSGKHLYMSMQHVYMKMSTQLEKMWETINMVSSQSCMKFWRAISLFRFRVQTVSIQIGTWTVGLSCFFFLQHQSRRVYYWSCKLTWL